jgi:hypothetical protein
MDFFFTLCNNLSFKEIRRSVFLDSIHKSLMSDLQDITSVKAMYESIRKKFQTVSRTAQMNLWYKLLAFNINPSVPTAGVATHLRDLYAEMKVVNVRMHGNILLGLSSKPQSCILQRASRKIASDGSSSTSNKTLSCPALHLIASSTTLRYDASNTSLLHHSMLLATFPPTATHLCCFPLPPKKILMSWLS